MDLTTRVTAEAPGVPAPRLQEAEPAAHRTLGVREEPVIQAPGGAPARPREGWPALGDASDRGSGGRRCPVSNVGRGSLGAV